MSDSNPTPIVIESDDDYDDNDDELAKEGEIVEEVRPLFFNFLVYGFLGGKNGSVGRKKIKNNFFFQKALLCQVVEKSHRYMEIVLKNDVLRNY